MTRLITRPIATSLGPPHTAPPARSGRFPSLRVATVIAAAAMALTAACGGIATSPADPADPATPVEQGPPKGSELATAEAVMEASIVAQGGRERIGKVKAIRQIGTVLLPQMGMKGSFTSVMAPPRNTLLTIELPGLGKISQGVSGDIAWELNPITGSRVITGDERTQLLREATFNADLVWKQLYPTAALAGVVDFAGQQAYQVVLTAPDGDAQTRYFAKDTLLPLGVQTVARSQMGKVPVEATVSDWRDVNGIKYPHKMARKEGPQSIEIIFDKIELDPPLDPSTFALPPEIAALPKPAPAAPPPSAPAAKPKQ